MCKLFKKPKVKNPYQHYILARHNKKWFFTGAYQTIRDRNKVGNDTFGKTNFIEIKSTIKDFPEILHQLKKHHNFNSLKKLLGHYPRYKITIKPERMANEL